MTNEEAYTECILAGIAFSIDSNWTDTAFADATIDGTIVAYKQMLHGERPVVMKKYKGGPVRARTIQRALTHYVEKVGYYPDCLSTR